MSARRALHAALAACVLSSRCRAWPGRSTSQTLDAGKGEQVWYVEDHTLPMIAMSAALPAGSAYDPADKAGPCRLRRLICSTRARATMQLAGLPIRAQQPRHPSVGLGRTATT